MTEPTTDPSVEDPDGVEPLDDGTPGPHNTDLGNATRFVREYGATSRFNASRGAWLYWNNDALWEHDRTGEIQRRVAATVKRMYLDGAAETDADLRKAMIAHALKSESARALAATASLAETFRDVVLTDDAFDADRSVLDVLNGVVDLRTGELRPHRAEDLHTRRVPVALNPRAVCPRFERFLDEVFLSDRELIEFVRRSLGYALSGLTHEQCMFVWFGGGWNGKSTLLELFRDLAGTYAANADISTFVADDDAGRPRNDIARLAGARFVSASELEEGRRLAESVVKSLTGSDTITARFLYREAFEFRPQFKVFLATNHLPVIRGTDTAIWRRIRAVPFRASFPPERQEKGLHATLRGELPGILAWAVRGAVAALRDGLGTAKAVTDATAEYREGQDTIGRFLEDRCDVGATYSDTSAHLYAVFSRWCEEEGERAWTKKSFGMRLEERGFRSLKDAEGERCREGLHARGYGSVS